MLFQNFAVAVAPESVCANGTGEELAEKRQKAELKLCISQNAPGQYFRVNTRPSRIDDGMTRRAVSYTHLDVYKRQDIYFAVSNFK